MIKLVACFGTLLALCSAQEREEHQAPGLTGDVVMAHGSTLEGTHSVESFHIPANAVVQVTGDLRIVSSTTIVVDGVLFAANGTREQPTPDIVLIAEDTVSVKGVITGGRGECYGPPGSDEDVGVPGGAGTDIDLVGRYVVANKGHIVAGEGGSAGPGGQGGAGGDIFVYGGKPAAGHWSYVARAANYTGGGSGMAGKGTREFNNGQGGRGGHGGSVMHYSRAEYPEDR